MKEAEKSSRKHIIEMRKHSISEKTRSDNPTPPSAKDDPFSPFLNRPMKSLGRKYAQENLFKAKQKEHHEIVISDQVVRNSKLYRMLREKICMRDAVFVKQTNHLSETKQALAKEITDIRAINYNSKLSLWELKNQILELKNILNDEEEEARRLEAELSRPQQEYYSDQEEQQQQEMDLVQGQQQECKRGSEGGRCQKQQMQQEQLEQSQMDIRLIVSQLHKKFKFNPEGERLQQKSQQKESEKQNEDD